MNMATKPSAITPLMGLADSEVFSRSVGRSPTVYGEHIQISLETRLYNMKTESMIGVGESQTKDPKTTGPAIGQVVDVVMNELHQNG